MIKIRYSELQAGLHATTKTEGGHTVLYLVPGLSAVERRSAIDRLRASAKVGHGPKLHTIPLALALIADRVKQNTKNAVAAARLHPTGVAIPAVVLVSGAILYALFVTVSVNLGLPVTSDLAVGPLPVAAAPASGGNSQRGPGPGASQPGGPSQASRLTGARSSGSSGPSARSGRPGKSSPHPTTGPTPTTPPSSSPRPTGGSSTPTVSIAPTPSPSKSGGTGSCLNLILIRLCA
ncbi:MAG TPA: hypothetical protein VHY58_03005 [Streptosporangiaceae bacterium]|nr:hypothetical protein [Streptosporangiaceae bacterium]